MTKRQDKNLNALRAKKAFEVKAFFIIFKGLSIVKNCLRPESAPLNLGGLVSDSRWL